MPSYFTTLPYQTTVPIRRVVAEEHVEFLSNLPSDHRDSVLYIAAAITLAALRPNLECGSDQDHETNSCERCQLIDQAWSELEWAHANTWVEDPSR